MIPKTIFEMTSKEVTEMISNTNDLKPKDLVIDDLQWKYLVRAVLRGKNILFVGPTRCGKTKAAKSAVESLKLTDKFFYFNIGSTQDARASLVGNTMFKKDTGTIFHPSQFVKAIQTPGAVILLDELSRGHHDAWNILMPVLDTTQRYLRLDETEDSSIVPVAEGVTFIATANIGNEYTATRVMDKALTARFPVIIEMKPLDAEQEEYLLGVIYSDATEEQKRVFSSLCKISGDTKIQFNMADAKISAFIPTGTVVEMAELVIDGFSLEDIAETMIYPLYGAEGGPESERLYVKQMVQKYLTVRTANVSSPVNDPKKKKVTVAF